MAVLPFTDLSQQAADAEAEERHVATTLGALSETIAIEGIANPAILFIRYPKSLARALAGTGAVIAA